MKPLMLAYAAVAALVAALLLPLTASAEVQSYSAQYELESDVVSVDVEVGIGGNVSRFEWIVPEDAKSLDSSPPPFEVVELEDSRRLVFSGSLPRTVAVKYKTASLLQHAGGTSFFIADVPATGADGVSVLVALPEGATLKHSVDSPVSSFVPQTGQVITNGKRIIVRWDETDFVSGTSILVMYNTGTEKGVLLPLLAVAALALLAVLSVFVYIRRKGKPLVLSAGTVTDASALTRNLFEGEKKIIQLLVVAKDSELWQKQIEISTGFPKVTLSRKLRSLEQKGLIEKVPYGNANKIRLKKPSQA
ncbi:hypothetical protein HYU18_04725 [Candidatus Woesearchaeota archaeon]|nr:hypothetical protein [Candidatus Woesearchaeota archaeon]